MEILNMDKYTWEFSSQSPRYLQNHSSIVVGDVIYVIGGNKPHETPSPLMYDTADETWSERTPPPVHCLNATVLTLDNMIYVNMKGQVDMTYNLATDTWCIIRHHEPGPSTGLPVLWNNSILTLNTNCECLQEEDLRTGAISTSKVPPPPIEPSDWERCLLLSTSFAPFIDFS